MRLVRGDLAFSFAARRAATRQAPRETCYPQVRNGTITVGLTNPSIFPAATGAGTFRFAVEL